MFSGISSECFSALLRHLCEVKPSDLLHIQGHFFILEHSDKIECQETLSNLIGCLVFATRAVPRTADELIQSKHSKKLLNLYLRASNKDLVIGENRFRCLQTQIRLN